MLTYDNKNIGEGLGMCGSVHRISNVILKKGELTYPWALGSIVVKTGHLLQSIDS